MKICHMTSVHASIDVRIFHKECASLVKAGYDTYLVAKGTSREENGVHVVGVGEPPAKRINRMLFFSRVVYKKALEIDAEIYHLHDPELLPYALKLKNLGKKVIFDSHEKYDELFQVKYYLPAWLRNTVGKIYEKYESFVLARIDAVIFPCLLRGEHPFKGKCKRTITVDNFPLLEELYNDFDEASLKEENSICYVGNLTKDRGITVLVSAMDKVEGTLLLAGSFAPLEYEDELRSMNAWEKVKYLGYLNREEVKTLIKKTQVGAAVIPNLGQYNKYDNLATKVYEYMSLGVPVILTKAPYNAWVNHKYGFGICVDSENENEIASAINYLFSHPEESKLMGQNGRRAVEQEFNWATQEKKLLKLYGEL